MKKTIVLMFIIMFCLCGCTKKGENKNIEDTLTAIIFTSNEKAVVNLDKSGISKKVEKLSSNYLDKDLTQILQLYIEEHEQYLTDGGQLKIYIDDEDIEYVNEKILTMMDFLNENQNYNIIYQNLVQETVEEEQTKTNSQNDNISNKKDSVKDDKSNISRDYASVSPEVNISCPNGTILINNKCAIYREYEANGEDNKCLDGYEITSYDNNYLYCEKTIVKKPIVEKFCNLGVKMINNRCVSEQIIYTQRNEFKFDECPAGKDCVKIEGVEYPTHSKPIASCSIGAELIEWTSGNYEMVACKWWKEPASWDPGGWQMAKAIVSCKNSWEKPFYPNDGYYAYCYGLYEEPDQYAYYTCPTGYILTSKNTCEAKIISNTGVIERKYCEEGYTFNNTDCIKKLTDKKELNYSCNSKDDTYSNVTHKCTTMEYKSIPTIKYTCPDGYSLENATCIKYN